MSDRWHKVSAAPTVPFADEGVAQLSVDDLLTRSTDAAPPAPLDEKLRQAYYWIVNRAVVSPYYDVEFSTGSPV